VRGTFLSPKILFCEFQRDYSLHFTVSNLVLKFHNDPTVDESEIIVLLGQVYVNAGKREGLGRGGRKNEFERKRERRDVS